VLIETSPNTPTVAYTRVGNPQSYDDLPDANDFYINWTEPIPYMPGEPFYKITFSAPSWNIFLSSTNWDALQPTFSPGGDIIGRCEGAESPGAGNPTWTIVVNRSVGWPAVNPIRLRPDQVGTTLLTITIENCIFYQGVTAPCFQGPDWTPQTTTVVVTLSGSFCDKAPTIVGTANETVLAVIYGVVGFVGLVLIIACYCLIRCLLRRHGSGGGGGGGVSAASPGSSGSPKKSSKAKKSKSAYLHQVEL